MLVNFKPCCVTQKYSDNNEFQAMLCDTQTVAAGESQTMLCDKNIMDFKPFCVTQTVTAGELQTLLCDIKIY